MFLGDADRREEEFSSGPGRAQPSAAGKSSGFEDVPIEELELGVRSYNCLKREGIESVGDLIAKSEQELMCIPNFGRKSIRGTGAPREEQSEA